MKFYRIIFLIVVLTSAGHPVFAGKQITVSVQTGEYSRENTVVCLDLKQTGLDPSKGVKLLEIINGKKVAVPSQLESISNENKLYWVLSDKTPAKTVRTFLLAPGKAKKTSSPLKLMDKDGSLTVTVDKHPVIQYHYQTVYPPAGIDTAFKRSGFIHPAWSPAGDTLTNIQPKDHYHHYGIWNPWTKVEYDGKLYDLWNLKDRKGTVRFSKFLKKEEGPVFAGFKALQGHYIFNDSQEKEIMEEIWNIKVWNYAGSTSFLWDFESLLHPNTALPVILKAYRYAGFSIRATDHWTKDNCVMLTSEDKQRPEIDGTKARWIYLTGTSPKGKAGILFMSHPTNYNYPEPLRIWDQKSNGGRGDAFMNFAPTKDIDWVLEAGKRYHLSYRVFMYDGEINSEKAEQLWTDFAFPPTVSLK